MAEIKVALIGFGGIARAHSSAYQKLQPKNIPVKLVAVCDRDATKFKEKIAINLGDDQSELPDDVICMTDMDELIATVDFDVADICLPSFLHKDVTVKMLRAGKHVLCEKPMALSSSDADEMVRTAKEENKQLMVGQCLRFSEHYRYLKDCIETNRYGKLKNLILERYTAYPRWGAQKWFDQTDKCGGCLIDTHIHDVDIARFLLGDPQKVTAIAYNHFTEGQYVNSRLLYKNGPSVVANCIWDEPEERDFYAGFHAEFEQANVVLSGQFFRVYEREKEPFEPLLPATDFTEEEIRYFCELLLDPNKNNTVNPPESAAASVRLVETLRDSARNGGAIISF